MKTFTQFMEEKIEQISEEDFPFDLNDIISCETISLGGCDTPEGMAHVKRVRETAELLRIDKVYGYGSDFKKSQNQDDFIYEVTIKYIEKAIDEIPTSRLTQRPYFANPGERTYKNRMMIGVNQEGKSAVFMN